jgi:hypothetical protein
MRNILVKVGRKAAEKPAHSLNKQSIIQKYFHLPWWLDTE